jgi:hypothetical protein
MKNLKFYIFFCFLGIISCSKDDYSDPNAPAGTYLTINGDTREIVHNGDPDLKITKEILHYITYDVISLDIDDYNHSLIANFGDYNYRYYLSLRFYLPKNFSAGKYTSTNDYPYSLSKNEANSEFFAATQFAKRIKAGQSFRVNEEGNKWIVEFKNLEYEGDGSIAIISGRIILNK